MEKATEVENYYFRDIHPKVLIGTASDRYVGWIGQIYSEELYRDKISSRSKKVGGKSFVEKVLPVKSVREYFQHFRTLELDFTFYGLLLDKSGKPTPTFHVLRAYRSHLEKDDKLILKVPQIVFAKKLMRSGKMIENGNYLNSKIFIEQFYEPAMELLDQWLDGLIFEQEYQRKKERSAPDEQAKNLDVFFENIPEDSRYHIELRTESFLSEPVFNVFDKYGVGQVLSHWTWLPSLKSQFGKSGGRFFNSGKHSIIRLMTPKGMRYEKAYAKAHPFNKLVDGMLNPQMVKETVEIVSSAVEEGSKISIVVNNRAGGNAPLIAVQVAKQFLTSIE